MFRNAVLYSCAVALLCVGCGRPVAERAQAAESQDATSGHVRVRLPAVAGLFYPDDPQELRQTVTRCLDRAAPPPVSGRLLALVVPHAGYQFSAPVAAFAYKLISGLRLDHVVVVGPSHASAFSGALLTESAAWRTPLGDAPVDTQLSDGLAAAAPELFRRSDALQAREHSIEVQLPFLQVVLGDFKFVPVLLNDFSEENCRAVASALAKALKGRRALLVASTDLAHYPDRDLCRRVDLCTLGLIERMDIAGLYAWEEEATKKYAARDVSCTMCGLGPVVTVLLAAKELGADTVLRLKYANSGDLVAFTADRSVGYGAVAVSDGKGKPLLPDSAEESETGGNGPAGGGAKMEEAPLGSADNLSDEQKKTLLKLARKAIQAWVGEGRRVKPPEGDPAFCEPRAVFVTLKSHGRLRGCIGCLEPEAPLGEAVVEYAISAAVRDPRFPPVSPQEVKELDIHISVLSPLRPVNKPEDIVLGKHGIVVAQGFRRGVFLPEVAVEQGWDLPTTLSILCQEKAGLPSDAWKRDAKLYVFTTQSFGEEDFADTRKH
ncbi:MAG: AmmeMemoRadiSam system protein B [Armatimonadetes bacterium]|nr:AmmeMemoRadiSam system protein B [Armatimonadota bacterium]